MGTLLIGDAAPTVLTTLRGIGRLSNELAIWIYSRSVESVLHGSRCATQETLLLS